MIFVFVYVVINIKRKLLFLINCLPFYIHISLLHLIAFSHFI